MPKTVGETFSPSALWFIFGVLREIRSFEAINQPSHEVARSVVNKEIFTLLSCVRYYLESKVHINKSISSARYKDLTYNKSQYSYISLKCTSMITHHFRKVKKNHLLINLTQHIKQQEIKLKIIINSLLIKCWGLVTWDGIHSNSKCQWLVYKRTGDISDDIRLQYIEQKARSFWTPPWRSQSKFWSQHRGLAMFTK